MNKKKPVHLFIFSVKSNLALISVLHCYILIQASSGPLRSYITLVSVNFRCRKSEVDHLKLFPA